MLVKDKVCLVTGASKGIGLATAKVLAENGGIVYANYKDTNSLNQEFNSFLESSAQVKSICFDVTNGEQVKQGIQEIYKNEKRLDVLINNAGIVSYELLPFLNTDRLAQMFEVNSISVIRLIQLASRLMVKQKSGSIINVSSVVSTKGVSGQLAYSSSKGAVNSITLSAAKELVSSNIRVNAIAPGMVATERLEKVMQEKFQDKLANIGFGRLAEPVEIANVCLFLASDLSSYVTGQIIEVDGGLRV